MQDTSSTQQRVAARKTALWVALCALGVYALFIYVSSRGAGG